MTDSTFAIAQIIVFVAASTPLVLEGINNWTAGNRNNAILFGTGAVMAFASFALGHSSFSLVALGLGVAIAAGLLAVAATGAISGGVAKSCMALLPWLSTDTWLAVFTAGMLIAGCLGLIFKRNVLIAPPMVAAAAVALALPLVT
jgi:hypothetical protein